MNPVAAWLIRIWLYVISGIAGGVICCLKIHWKQWSTQRRLTGFFLIALVGHILEEWVWPAGLFYIHNLAVGSPDPSCYPMNPLSDMITNFVAVLMALWILRHFGDNAVAGFALALFGIGEAAAHTRLGILSVLHFGSAGLRFPYSPGLATALFGFLPVAVLLIRDLKKRGALHGKTVLFSVLCLLAAMVILVVIPENGLKDLNTPYRFPSAGFYEPYLD